MDFYFGLFGIITTVVIVTFGMVKVFKDLYDSLMAEVWEEHYYKHYGYLEESNDLF